MPALLIHNNTLLVEGHAVQRVLGMGKILGEFSYRKDPVWGISGKCAVAATGFAKCLDFYFIRRKVQ